MSVALPDVTDSVLRTIGRTPVVQLKRIAPPGGADVFVKLEYFNPTGSYKDRMALAMIEGAEARGALRPGMRVVEYTGGSTGSSLAHGLRGQGLSHSRRCRPTRSRRRSSTRCARSARSCEIVPSDGGKVTPALFDRFRERDRRARGGAEHVLDRSVPQRGCARRLHRQIGRELLEQTRGGGRVLRRRGDGRHAGRSVAGAEGGGSSARIVALEPQGSPVLTTGTRRRASRRRDRARVRTAASHGRDYDEARAVDEDEARAFARRLAKEEGVFAGTSTGLNVLAACSWPENSDPGKVVATVAVDTGLKYLAGDLFA